MGLLDFIKRPTNRQVVGAAAEQRALDYLLSRGLRLCESNFRCKGGEIDLVMLHGDELVFVEVRARSNSEFGGAAASITRSKQQRMQRAAHIYLRRYRMPPPCRFDVIAIDGEKLEWLQNVLS